MAETTPRQEPTVIEIIPRDGAPEALLCPALICDACREQVTGPGNIIWFRRHVPEWQSSPLFAAHKPCNRKVEFMLESLYPFDKGWQRGRREASKFLDQLAYNFGHPFVDDPDGFYHTQTVVHPGGVFLPNIHRNGGFTE